MPDNRMSDDDLGANYDKLKTFQNEVQKQLYDTKKGFLDVVRAMKEEVREELSFLVDLMESDREVRSGLTAAAKKDADTLKSYLQELVNKGRITEKQHQVFMSQVSDMSDSLSRTSNIFKKVSEAVELGIITKEKELKAYKSLTKSNKDYEASQNRIIEIDKDIEKQKVKLSKVSKQYNQESKEIERQKEKDLEIAKKELESAKKEMLILRNIQVQ
jgi:hypothetical protein